MILTVIKTAPGRWLGRSWPLLLVLALLAGCHTKPKAPPPRFSAEQVEAMRSHGFKQEPDGDWSFGVADRMLFASDNSALSPATVVTLGEITRSLLQVGLRHVRVDGYTDDSGAANHNLELSRKRAQTVANVLVDKGMAAANVSSRGLGSSNPVASNQTSEGRSENRRAVLVISAP